MLQDQTIQIALGKGLDTKSDAKLSAKPVLLENAVFTDLGDLQKRNGYDSLTLNIVGGGTLSGPKGVQSVNGELVCFDGGYLYAYSPEQSGWISRGKYQSVAVSDTTIGASAQSQSFQSQAVLGNYALFTYSVTNAITGFVETHVSVMDIVTGNFIVSDLNFPYAPTAQISGNTLDPSAKAVVLGSSTLAIVFLYNNSGTANIALSTVSISSSGVSFGTVHTLGTDIVGWADALNDDLRMRFDVIPTATGAVVAYASAASFTGTPSGLQVKLITSAGSVGTTASITSPGKAAPISLTRDSSTGNIWVNWADQTTLSAPTVYTALYTSTLSVVLGKTSVAVPGLQVNQIAGRVLVNSSQGIYYSQRSIVASSPWDLVSAVVSTSGTVSAGGLTLNGLDLASKPFQVGSLNYLLAAYRGGPDQSLFLLSLDTSVEGSVVAKALYLQLDLNGSIPGFIPAPIALSSTRVGISVPKIIEGTGTTTTYTVVASAMVSFDFNHADAYQGKVLGNTLILNGGIVQMYDGSTVSELGFHYPPVLTLTGSTSGGALADGTYGYAAVYEWTDEQGLLHQSAPGFGSVTISGGGGAGSVVIWASAMRIGARVSQNNLVLYRTDANGITHYQIGRVPYGGAARYNISDTGTVRQPSAPLLYTAGNVLENSAPPPAMLLETHNNRLWLIDSENPNTFWPSKIVSAGNGVSFAGELSVDMDTRGGSITAMAALDSNFVFFKGSLPFIVSGDAADETGADSSLSVPTPVQSDVGAANSRGIVSYSGGVIFKTPTGGIYRLDRALGITYLGREVEAYNSQAVTATNRISGTTQIRFLTSAGATLVYDYLTNQWSTFTNHLGYGADLWDGAYVYARTDGKIYVENQTTFLDGSTSYRLRAMLAWIKLAGVQGFQRARRIGLLGDYTNGTSGSHGVQISAAYDYGTSFSAPVAYTLGAGSSAGVFQYRERLATQKCTALQLLIEEIVSGASGEFLSLTDLSAEVGVKRGIRKLPQAQTLG